MKMRHIIGRVRSEATAFALMKALGEEFPPSTYKCEFSYGVLDGEKWIGIRACPFKEDHYLDYDLIARMIYIVRGFIAGRKSMVE
jgi:hypothetical protein